MFGEEVDLTSRGAKPSRDRSVCAVVVVEVVGAGVPEVERESGGRTASVLLTEVEPWLPQPETKRKLCIPKTEGVSWCATLFRRQVQCRSPSNGGGSVMRNACLPRLRAKGSRSGRQRCEDREGKRGCAYSASLSDSRHLPSFFRPVRNSARGRRRFGRMEGERCSRWVVRVQGQVKSRTPVSACAGRGWSVGLARTAEEPDRDTPHSVTDRPVRARNFRARPRLRCP